MESKMKGLNDTFTLHNGVKIPCVGFGTWLAEDGETCENAVKTALKAGYRHIDTAAGYGNEESVGRAIRESGIAREELFITSKLNNPDHGYEKTKMAFEETMRKLDCEYLDLYLIHWPNPLPYRDCWEETNAGSWKAMEEFYQEGRIRAIGLSNFRPHHMEALKKTAKVAPMVNQIRLCPGDVYEETVKYCREHEILLEAYSPLGHGQIFEVELMKELAAKYDKTIAQICVRWSLQMGFLPLPKSVTESRIVENGDVFNFSLSDEDVKRIMELDGCCGYGRNPDEAPF